MKSSLVIHCGWAVAMISAFLIGFKGSGNFSGTDSDRDSRSASTRSAQSLAGTDGRIGRMRDEERTDRLESKLEGLFGKIVVASGDFESLARQAFRDPNPITRRLAFSRLLEALTPENAQTIREQLVALGADESQWRDFHYSWGAMAGKAAVDHAIQSKESDLAATMSGWAANHPNEALAMLDQLPPELEGQRRELSESVIAGIAHSNPAMATELVLRLGREGNEQANEKMDIVAITTLRSKGAEEAALWAAALPEGPLKGTALRRVAESYATKDVVAAAQWAQSFAAKDYGAGAIGRVASQWVEKDPVSAVEWLEDLPAGEGQNAGLKTAFSDWEDSDPAAATSYLTAMRKSPQRDSAISGFATGYAWQNPQIAISWAQEIQDSGLRERSLTQAAYAYHRRDPEGARAWLPSSGLPAEAQRTVIEGRR